MVLLIGVYAKAEILGETQLGAQLLEMVVRRSKASRARRELAL
jgi:hypothetical protein